MVRFCCINFTICTFSAGLIDLFDENGVNFDLQQDELTPEEEPEKPFEDLVRTHCHIFVEFNVY